LGQAIESCKSPCLWILQRGEKVHALILALHEEDQHAQQVTRSLKLSGHGVIESKNFTHAIKVLNNQHVDLIISDVHLENGGNVFDFLRWAKKNPTTKDTPFVLFSFEPTPKAKYFEDGLRTTARMLGAAMYITLEVFDSDEFRKQIDSLLPEGNNATELAPLQEKGE
jgi:CheY-like chemotaxis protein